MQDGHFVPNLTLGAPIVAALRKHTQAFLDCHLMVSRPEQWVDDFANAGADGYTFHVEATGACAAGAARCGARRPSRPRRSGGQLLVRPCAPAPRAPAPTPARADDAAGLIERIRARGMKVGVALKPGTPVDAVLPLVGAVDMVLVMTVEPGFGGQSFMPAMMAKVAALRRAHPALHIQVDGGLGPKNIAAAAAAGACEGGGAGEGGTFPGLVLPLSTFAAPSHQHARVPPPHLLPGPAPVPSPPASPPGANVIVAGTSIFGAPAPREAIAQLRAAVAACAGREPVVD